MRTILLAFANADAAAKVKNVLVAAGLPVGRTFATGALVLQQAMLEPGGGVIVLPPRLSDMTVPDLLSRLPDTFDLVVLFGRGQPATFGKLSGITFLETPMPASELVNTVRSLLETRTAGIRRPQPAARAGAHGSAAKPKAEPPPPHRTPAEEKVLQTAKTHLINHCGLTEEEAHRNLQKRSMESGVRLVEIARQVLDESECCRSSSG